MIAAIDLNSDPTVTEKLKNIARYQSDDPQMQKVKEDLKAAQPPIAVRYSLLKYTLCCKDAMGHTYWSPFLQASLERQVIQFVHKALGYQSNDKCNVQLAHTSYCKHLGRKVSNFML